MPRQSFSKLPIAKRERLLKAAADELSERGFLDASMNRILAQAGLSKGVAYHYFDNREDLLVMVLRDRFQQSVADLALDVDALTAATFWDTLESVLLSVADARRWDSKTVAIARAVWAIPSEYRSRGAVGQLWEDMTGIVSRIVRHGQQIGMIRTDLPEDLLVEAVMALGEVGDRWWMDHWGTDSDPELGRFGGQVLGLMRCVLEPRRLHHCNS